MIELKSPGGELVGHGIGRCLHEEPQVPNFGARGKGLLVNAGGPEVRSEEDGWTAVTRDGQRSAHFEHSVAITHEGPYVLSQL